MNPEAQRIMMYPDERMNTVNAARYLGISQKTLAMLRCKGTGPKFVKRGRVFYFKADLDAWLAEGSATSTAQARQQRLTPAAIGRAARSRPVGKRPRA